jgi:hypothetical protein
MKKIFPSLSVLFGILACSTQPLPTQDVGTIVNATLTAIAQSNSQAAETQPTSTPSSVQELPSELHYYWPTTVPEGYVISTQISSASENSYNLDFINPSIGTITVAGGEYAGRYPNCVTGSTPQVVRGFDGCFPPSTGAGFSVQWKEGEFPYTVGGLGLSRELALQIAEQLEPLDFNTWKERLLP